MSDTTTAIAPRAADASPADTALAPIEFATGDQVRLSIRAFRELRTVLYEELGDATVEIAGKLHPTREFWNAVGVAGQISVRIVSERREVYERFDDGRDNFGWIVMAIAAAPNGREMPGDGSCFCDEKAESFKCPHEDPNRKGWSVHFPHSACPDFDADHKWRRRPDEATEHNCHAHATTR